MPSVSTVRPIWEAVRATRPSASSQSTGVAVA